MQQSQAAQSPKTSEASPAKTDSESTTSAEATAVDSGIGSSSEYDQDNSGNHLLEAQDDTSEASTDEGYVFLVSSYISWMLIIAVDTQTRMLLPFFRPYCPKLGAV